MEFLAAARIMQSSSDELSILISFGDCTKRIHKNRYLHHFHVPYIFFSSLARSRYFSLCSLSLFYPCG